mgnify:FL=1
MLINPNDVCLIIFNMQLELIPLLHNSYKLTHDCRWLADLFDTHQLPTVLIEHKKLGQLARSIKEVAPKAKIMEKHHFSIMKEEHILSHLASHNKKQLVLAGAESHVCIFQSSVNLQQAGYEIFVLSDTISARNESDNRQAIERLKYHQYQLITKEMLFFELIEHSELPNYLELARKFLDGRYIK